MSVADLRERFALSEVSIRRDLAYLDRQGLVERVHGGAQYRDGSRPDLVFQARMLRDVGTKRALGRAVANMVAPGDHLLLDSGTTVLEVARALSSELRRSGGLGVVTRSLSIASELAEEREIRLFVLGGAYAHDYDSFVGPQVEAGLRGLHVDKLVIGADGLVPERGLTSDNVMETGLYRLMVACASDVIVVADSGKIGMNHLQAILPFHDVHVLVTDTGAPGEFVEALRQQGVQVRTVDAKLEGSGG